MTPLDFIREKCVKANPGIVFTYAIDREGKEFKKIREIQLADVLLAVQESTNKWIVSERDLMLEFSWVEGELNFSFWSKEGGYRGAIWNLLESFENQKPEVHAFIANVLGYDGNNS